MRRNAFITNKKYLLGSTKLIFCSKQMLILLISALMIGVAFVDFAQAEQGSVRILGDGIDTSTLGTKKAQPPKAQVQNTQATKIAAKLGDPIGVVDSANDPATIRHVDGSFENLKPGAAIYQGDQLITGIAGSAVVFFKDQSTISMDADSQILMDELVYDPDQKRGSEVISLIQGIAVFASGNIAKMNPDAMTIHTPVATIGIRGTTFGVHYRGNRDVTVVLAEGAKGNVGEIFVRNQAGAVTLNKKFSATQVAGLNVPPTPPTPMPPRVFMNTFNDAIMQLPLRLKRTLKDVPLLGRDDPLRQLKEELLRR